MPSVKKMLAAAAGAGSSAMDTFPMEDCFHLAVRNGTSSTTTISTGIDLDTNGGSLWTLKFADGPSHGSNFNVNRGGTAYYWTTLNGTNHADEIGWGTDYYNNSLWLSSYGSSGHTWKSHFGMNSSYSRWVDFVFMNSGRFYQSINYTGDGSSSRVIKHDLGCDAGLVFIKKVVTSGSSGEVPLVVKHRAVTDQNKIWRFSDGNPYYGDRGLVSISGVISSMDDSGVTIGSHSYVNTNGDTYNMQVWAHDPDGTGGDDGYGRIACGSYTGSGNNTIDVDLGWDPVMVWIKRRDGTGDWVCLDNQRGLNTSNTTGNSNSTREAHLEDSEVSVYITSVRPTGQGFQVLGSSYADDNVNDGSDTYVYMAIRNGGTDTPSSTSEFFGQSNVSYSNIYTVDATAGFAPDMAIFKSTSGSNTRLYNRIYGRERFNIDGTSALSDGAPSIGWDFPNGLHSQGGFSNAYYAFMWKRQRYLFDCVTYSASSTAAQTIPHNLGAVPAMMLVKSTTNSSNPTFFHQEVDATSPEDYALFLDENYARFDRETWNDTMPTSTHFSVGPMGESSYSGRSYICWLFGEVSGLTKMGSYTGNNSSQTINCGFSSGTKWVMIKNVSNSGSYWIFGFDTGIVSGDVRGLALEATNSSILGDYLDPHNSGFTVNNLNNYLSANGDRYIYYAIAN